MHGAGGPTSFARAFPFALSSSASANMEAPTVTVDTSMGTFTIEWVKPLAPSLRKRADTMRLRRLYVSHAPKTCQNFLEVRRTAPEPVARVASLALA